MNLNFNIYAAKGYTNNSQIARRLEEFELKSKCGKLSDTITGGAYTAMIERINSDNNPNFFFLTYTKQWTVNDFLVKNEHIVDSKMVIESFSRLLFLRDKGIIEFAGRGNYKKAHKEFQNAAFYLSP